MRFVIGLAFATLAVAQPPVISGVWKADLPASQFPGGHGPTQYLEIISQSGSKITEQSGSWFPFGVSRSDLTYNTDGTPIIEDFEGVPSRETGEMKDGKLVVTVETDGRPDDTMTRSYDLSSDGQKLSISIHASHNGHAMESRLVLVKQPEEAGAPLRQAPPPAATEFKNLKTMLKDTNSVQFINTMHYFSWALNKPCDFCHVQRDFASDDKKPKRTARTMISMTNHIDQDTFHGKREVSCYTCHQFREKPQSRPLLPGRKAQGT